MYTRLVKKARPELYMRPEMYTRLPQEARQELDTWPEVVGVSGDDPDHSDDDHSDDDHSYHH